MSNVIDMQAYRDDPERRPGNQHGDSNFGYSLNARIATLGRALRLSRDAAWTQDKQVVIEVESDGGQVDPTNPAQMANLVSTMIAATPPIDRDREDAAA